MEVVPTRFHVYCPGADLVTALETNPTDLTSRPFALYVVALATQVDDGVLRWLKKYQLAIDSLTSDSTAFLLFFNAAELDSYAGPSSWPPHGRESLQSREAVRLKDAGLLDAYNDFLRARFRDCVFSEQQHKATQRHSRRRIADSGSGSSEEHAPPIEVDGSDIRGGARAVDSAVSMKAFELFRGRAPILPYSDYVGSPRHRLFVRSMDYQSNAVATKLGISDALPCLVFIDDPLNMRFEVLPLDEPGPNTVRLLRRIIAEFEELPANRKYMNQMRAYCKSRRDLGLLAASAHDALAAEPRNDSIVSQMRVAREALLRGRTLRFQHAFEEALRIAGTDAYPAYARVVSTTMLETLCELAGRKGQFRKAARMFHQMHPRARERLQMMWDELRTGNPALPPVPTVMHLNDVAAQLEKAVEERVSAVMESVAARLPPACADYLHWDDPSVRSSAVRVVLSQAHDVQVEMLRQAELLSSMPRPEIGSIVRKHASRTSRASTIKRIWGATSEMAVKGRPIIDAIRRAGGLE